MGKMSCDTETRGAGWRGRWSMSVATCTTTIPHKCRVIQELGISSSETKPPI